jgi:phenylacetate-CoA ligase
MYNFLAKNIFAPSLDLVRGTKTIRNFQELEQSQWWPRAKILELQGQRLRNLIQHAYDTVPYYRNIFDKRSLHPDDIKMGKDLYLLPVLTKKLIKSNYKNLAARNFPMKERVRLSTSRSMYNSVVRRILAPVFEL